jgi:hypothetical protein
MIIVFLVGLLFFCICFITLNFIDLLRGRNSFLTYKLSLTNFNSFGIIIFLLIVASTALIQTGFQTIQLLSLPLLAILIFKKQKTESKHQITLLEIFSVFTFSFLLLYVAFGFPDTAGNINIHYDIHYYAKLSQKLMEANSENGGVLLSSYIDNKGITLYHFSDLWFTGFFAEVFNISNISILSFFTYPILLTFGILTLKDFLFQFGWDSSKLKTYLVIFLVLFGTCLPLCLSQNDFFNISYSRYLVAPGVQISSTKTLILLPLIALSINSIIRHDYLSFVCYLLLAEISYSTTLILFTCALFLLSLYKLSWDFKTKTLYTRTNYSLAFLLLGFYSLLFLMLINWVDFSVLPSFSTELPIKSIIILFIEYNLSPLLVYFLPLFFILFIKSKEKKWFAIKLIAFLVITISITSLYVIKQTGDQNALQSIINSVPYIFILLSLFIFQSSEKIVQNILLFVFSCSAVYNISNNTLYNGSFNQDEKTIQEMLKNERGSIRWAVIDSSLTENKYYKCNQTGCYLFYNQNLDYPVDLSNFFILSKEEIKKMPKINISPLDENYLKNRSKTRESVFIDFIKENNISFILSNNRLANEMINKFSAKDKHFKLRFSNGGLELWKIGS